MPFHSFNILHCCAVLLQMLQKVAYSWLWIALAGYGLWVILPFIKTYLTFVGWAGPTCNCNIYPSFNC